MRRGGLRGKAEGWFRKEEPEASAARVTATPASATFYFRCHRGALKGQRGNSTRATNAGTSDEELAFVFRTSPICVAVRAIASLSRVGRVS